MLKILCFLFLLVSINANAYHIIIDPGHGGTDNGAVRGKFKESRITLSVSKFLEQLLKADPRFEATLTRKTNGFMSLVKRTEIANKKRGDVFISIHVNSSLDKSARGSEFYFQNQLPPEEEALFLANFENQHQEEPKLKIRPFIKDHAELEKNTLTILEDLRRTHRIKKSGELSIILAKGWSGSRKKQKKNSVHQAPFYVINNVDMPSVLIELGFISNRTEAMNLSSPTYQRKLARSIYQSLINFKEVIDKPHSSSLD